MGEAKSRPRKQTGARGKSCRINRRWRSIEDRRRPTAFFSPSDAPRPTMRGAFLRNEEGFRVQGSGFRYNQGMNIEQWTAVEEYIGRNLVKEDKALSQALADSRAARLPGIQVTPNLGKLLTLIAKVGGGRSSLEIRTLGGCRTVWRVRGLGKGGKLITLELEQKHI